MRTRKIGNKNIWNKGKLGTRENLEHEKTGNMRKLGTRENWEPEVIVASAAEWSGVAQRSASVGGVRLCVLTGL